MYTVYDSTLDVSMSKEDAVHLTWDGANWVDSAVANIFTIYSAPGTPITSQFVFTSIGTLIRFNVLNNEVNNISINMSIQGI